MTGHALAKALDNNQKLRRNRKGRRETVRAACNFCCSRKIKCDALRPQCSACVSRGRECVYDTKDDDETRGAATKRRCDDLEKQLAILSLTKCDACKALASQQAANAGEGSSAAAAAAAAAAMAAMAATAATAATVVAVAVAENPAILDIDHLAISASESGAQSAYAAAIVPRASEILSTLLTSTDEEGAGILAALRIGLLWKRAEQVDSGPSTFAGEHQGSIMDMMSPASATDHEDAASKGGNVAMSNVRHDGEASMMFSRLIWLREVVRYNSSTSSVVEHIQVVSTPAADPQDSTSSSRSTAMNASARSGLRCTYQVPLCAVASMIDVGDIRCPFVKAYLEMSTDINMGADVQTMFGSSAQISALTSDEMWLRAPRLSQVVASMVQSMKLDGDEGDLPRTRCALMWLHWLLWRWLLDTSAASFQALPEMLRPTPWQLTVPHPLVFDFMFSPRLRDHLCQERILDCQWVTAVCATISCDDSPDDFYAVDPFTGGLDLSDAAKEYVAQPNSWSVGASVRPYFYNLNLDQYIRVRPQPSLMGI